MTQLPFRSVLFAPGNRADVLAKLPRSGPDAAVIDLEDATPADQKAEARVICRQVTADLTASHPGLPLLVRINAADTGHFADDVADGLSPGLAGVVVPMLDSSEAVEAVADALDAAGHTDLPIMAGLETVAGVVDARTVTTHPRVAWCYFGAEDYVVDLGGVRTDSNDEVAVARAQVAQAARVGGVHAIDMVVRSLDDEARFRRESAEARALGFSGKLCIHPAHVALAHDCFQPTDAEIAWAGRVVEAWEAAVARGDAAIQVDGGMVDEPVARRARAILGAD
ncbi:MAG: CoA ester lyase [Acidimicrobiales bacterium]|jgi:citrate lyase subunit beta/citryl-CoA lyase|nr:CoA ester lyase [Acidimicrobiales bacterium]MDP6239471.1 CoA ester lyase [Acidimicrobiales bacterium]MDP7124108.1 CoA ester lyase [Acidimicrobiales bacterium]MDP7351679.1 CoA ester lyase [Acidimicrobiales bacterium]MDP7509213.1 CoA ester lyase [Acidimicrobiales bacterium]